MCKLIRISKRHPICAEIITSLATIAIALPQLVLGESSVSWCRGVVDTVLLCSRVQLLHSTSTPVLHTFISKSLNINYFDESTVPTPTVSKKAAARNRPPTRRAVACVHRITNKDTNIHIQLSLVPGSLWLVGMFNSSIF